MQLHFVHADLQTLHTSSCWISHTSSSAETGTAGGIGSKRWSGRMWLKWRQSSTLKLCRCECVRVFVYLHGHHKCYTFDMCDHPATTIHTVSLNSFCNCFFLLIGRKLASMFHLATVYPLMCMCLWTKQVVRKMAYTWEAKFLYWQSRLNFGPLAQNDPTQPLLSPYFYKWCQLAQY
jgi:hypothetical protein